MKWNEHTHTHTRAREKERQKTWNKRCLNYYSHHANVIVYIVQSRVYSIFCYVWFEQNFPAKISSLLFSSNTSSSNTSFSALLRKTLKRVAVIRQSSIRATFHTWERARWRFSFRLVVFPAVLFTPPPKALTSALEEENFIILSRRLVVYFVLGSRTRRRAKEILWRQQHRRHL